MQVPTDILPDLESGVLKSVNFLQEASFARPLADLFRSWLSEFFAWLSVGPKGTSLA